MPKPRHLAQDEPPRLSASLADLARTDLPDRVAIAHLMSWLGRRGHIALILIFAALNVIPMPPGSSLFLGAPIAILAWRFACGYGPWLPQIILQWSVGADRCRALIGKLQPRLIRAERMIRPRGARFLNHAVERLVGFCILGLSAVVMIPLPLTAILPALAICLIALGLLERDLLWIALGLLLGAGSVIVMIGVLSGLARAAILFIFGS